MLNIVVVSNIFEEEGVIFTNTFIILSFLIFLCIFIYCRQFFLSMSSSVIRLYLLRFVNNLNIEF
jgi:hypothetical protein